MTKIMLVEDDKSLREIYGIRLIAEGYEIKSAGDGEEALAMIIKERPDLVISDVMMPKISGFDMLDILRATPETKDIRVIMMTALSSEDQRSRGQALGADRYLVKSQVGIEDVVRTVHDVLGDAPNSTKPAAPAFSSPFAAPTAAKPAPAPTPMPTLTAEPQVSNEMPRPTAPFSSSGPASLGDNMVKPAPMPSPMPMTSPAPASMPEAEVTPMQPTPQPVVPTPIQVTVAPEAAAPTPEPVAAFAPMPEPTPQISQAPVPAPTYNPTPMQPTAAPIQDVSPAPQQMAQPTPVDIADLIAKELGNHETPQNPAQPQA
jgi:CheY-like chemotaxis protein